MSYAYGSRTRCESERHDHDVCFLNGGGLSCNIPLGVRFTWEKNGTRDDET